MNSFGRTQKTLGLLEELTKGAFALAVPEEFVARFMEGRRAIRAATEHEIRAAGRYLEGTEYALKQGGNHLWGQSTVEENFALTQIVEWLQPQGILEIGLFRGQTALTLHRAQAAVKDWAYLGIDPDPVAISTTRAVLKKFGLGEKSQFTQETSRAGLENLPTIDFALIDGDHAYASVAADFAAVYNRLPVGGVVAMHDVGTPAYGFTQQDPGHLLHRVLPNILGGDAQRFCLDGMCRQTTMQLLSPERLAFTDTAAEAQAIARVTMVDTVDGWGGMGFVVKLSPTRKVELAELLAHAPVAAAESAGPAAKRGTIFGRAARKLAKYVP